MLTLALDTAADFGSLALADEQGLREEIEIHAPRGFSHVLFGNIEALLARQQVRLEDIDLYAGASGPGSFTGVRVGLAALKGLAEVFRKPVVAVSNLEAHCDFATADLRAVVIDAHRGEVYAAVYDREGTQIVPEVVVPFDKFLKLLPDRDFQWLSQDLGKFIPQISGTRFESYPRIPVPLSLAGAIARIAIRKAANGLAQDPAAIEANYVRRSDAELLWKQL